MEPTESTKYVPTHLWYLESKDTNTDQAILNIKKQYGEDDEAMPNTLCGDGKRRDLWPIRFQVIARMQLSKAQKNYKYEIFRQRSKDSPIERWTPFGKKKRKTVLILHQLRDSDTITEAENIENILGLLRNQETENIKVYAPYIVSRMYLKNTQEDAYERGKDALFELIKRKTFDEVWLEGPRLSEGMEDLVLGALEVGVSVIPKTPVLIDQYLRLLAQPQS